MSPEDVPYIIKLQFTSQQDCQAVYLLTANFSEKEKWDSTLEAIVKRGNMSDAHHGENVCSLHFCCNHCMRN